MSFTTRAAIGAALLVTASGCASQVVNPVGPEFRRAYAVERVTVSLTDEQGLPDRYDEAVTVFYGEGMPVSEKAAFDAFREGTAPDQIAEQYLVYRIDQLVNERVPVVYRGSRPATATMDITNTTFPNAATMMLVGEIKNITFDLRVTDAEADAVLIETPKPMTVAGDASAGAGGGLLGLALRSGQHMNDLETLANNAAEVAADFLAADTVSSAIVKRIAVYPDRIETEAPAEPTALEPAASDQDVSTGS